MKVMFEKSLLCGLFVLLISSCAMAETDYLKADPAAIDHWQSMRFGLMICWGPVSLTGQEIGWSRGRETPIEEYDQLYKRFNPESFNAEEWIKIIKGAGIKYIVFLTKHHDGFCMWPSKYTDYDIASTPFKRNVLKELSEACKKYGIEFGTYYSTCDWHHPDYPKQGQGGKIDNPNSNLPRYSEYLQNQCKELIENYGPLFTLWFDIPRGFSSEYGISAIQSLRKLQPGIVINNRIYEGDPQPVADYDTPEQKIGSFNRQRPWETCMTIGRQWAWKPNEELKSNKECIQALLYTIGGDGNFLFNVGPMPDGRIDPRQAAVLQEMGKWVAKYSDCIFGTRGGPFVPGKWGASVCKDNKIYLFIMNWPDNESLQLKGKGFEIISHKLLSGGKVTVEQNAQGIAVTVPKENRNDIATVVELTVSGKAFDIEPVKAVSLGKKSTSSGRWGKKYDAARAFDGFADTRWAANKDAKVGWLEVDLAADTTVKKVLIDEDRWNRIRKFELQYLAGQEWKVIYGGTTIGPNKEIIFEPVKAQRFRLNILEASDVPTICEFQLFEE